MAKCSRCDSATINGVYCHEIGCPDSRKSNCPVCNEFRELTENRETGDLLCDSCHDDQSYLDEEFNDNVEWRE